MPFLFANPCIRLFIDLIASSKSSPSRSARFSLSLTSAFAYTFACFLALVDTTAVANALAESARDSLEGMEDVGRKEGY